MSTVSLITEMFGEGLSAFGPAHYFNRRVLCPRSNDIEYTSEEVNSLDGQSETYVKAGLHSTDNKEEEEDSQRTLQPCLYAFTS
jgi:hypothetical protein